MKDKRNVLSERSAGSFHTRSRTGSHSRTRTLSYTLTYGSTYTYPPTPQCDTHVVTISYVSNPVADKDSKNTHSCSSNLNHLECLIHNKYITNTYYFKW